LTYLRIYLCATIAEEKKKDNEKDHHSRTASTPTSATTYVAWGYYDRFIIVK